MIEARELSAVRAANREVVQESVTWISKKYGDAMVHWVENVWFADLNEDERKGLSTADPAIRAIHDTNVLEQMIAEGKFIIDEQEKRVLDIILDASLNLTDSQRTYLEQLGERALLLYSVSRCEPGEGFALKPYADGGEEVFIEDKWISRMLDVDDVVGSRLMQTGGKWETSGAVYHIPEVYVDELATKLKDLKGSEYSYALIRYWLGLVAAHV